MCLGRNEVQLKKLGSVFPLTTYFINVVQQMCDRSLDIRGGFPEPYCTDFYFKMGIAAYVAACEYMYAKLFCNIYVQFQLYSTFKCGSLPNVRSML